MESLKENRGRHGVALFGLGRMGQLYFRQLSGHPRAKILYVVKRNIDEGKKFIDDNAPDSDVQVVPPENLDKVLSDDRIDAVLIASISSSHEEIVMASIKNGKHIFCEKPLVPVFDIQRTDAIYDCAKKSDVLLHLAFQRRFDPNFQDAWRSIREGKIGKLQSLRVCSRDPSASIDYLRTSGGILVDTVVHDFDVMLWMTGDIPVSVYMTGHAYNPDIAAIPDLDVVVIVIKFKSGAIGMIENCREGHFGYDQRLEAFGTKGMLKVENVPLTSVKTFIEGSHSASLSKDQCVERYYQAYLNELNHFFNAVDGTERLSVLREHVVWGMRLVEAASESFKTGVEVKI